MAFSTRPAGWETCPSHVRHSKRLCAETLWQWRFLNTPNGQGDEYEWTAYPRPPAIPLAAPLPARRFPALAGIRCAEESTVPAIDDLNHPR